MPKPYSTLKQKHIGETCWIVGAGTSLLGIYNHPDKNKIFDDVVITTNSGIFMMPWGIPHPNKDIKSEVKSDPEKRYWVSNDSLCRRWSWWDYVKKCHAIKIIRDSWKPYYSELSKDFLYFWPRDTSEDVIDPDRDGLAYCSSVPTSIDLCISTLGIKRIFLCGVDQYMVGERSHFWQFFEKNNQPTRIDRVMATHSQQMEVFEQYNNIAYPALKEHADNKGVEIYNCNSRSSVNVFEKISFDEALNVRTGS